MIRRLLCRIGGNGLKGLFVVFYSPLVLLFSLAWFCLFSDSVNAYGEINIGLVHDMGSPSALDFSEYSVNSLGINASVILNDNNTYYTLSGYSDFSNWNSSNRSGSIYKPNSWSFNGYDADNIDVFVPSGGLGSSDNPRWGVPLTSSSSGLYIDNDVIKMSCSDDKYYWGDSITLSNSYIESLGNTYDNTGNMSNNYSYFNTSYSDSSGNGTWGRVGNPIYLQYQNVVYSNLSDNGTFITIYEVQNNLSDSVYIDSLGTSQYRLDEFYALDSNGSDSTTSEWMLNGAVVGCSETAVKNMLLSKDPVAEVVNPVPSGFPASFDSNSTQNNEDAWDILNNIAPDGFQFNIPILSDVLDFLSSLSSVFVDIPQGIEYCQIYMPAFFSNRFSFGNNGGDNDFLYVNLCDNSFVSRIWDSSSWIGVISSKSSYYNQQWLYIGVKGLIWLFCLWILFKLILGFIYWVYEVIDITFDLKSVGGNLG